MAQPVENPLRLFPGPAANAVPNLATPALRQKKTAGSIQPIDVESLKNAAREAKTVAFLIDGKSISIPCRLMPPDTYRACYIGNERGPLDIRLDNESADRRIPRVLPKHAFEGKELRPRSNYEENAPLVQTDVRVIKPFDFYGHGTNLYAFLMSLNFTDGRLIGRRTITEKLGLPVPHGEKGYVLGSQASPEIDCVSVCNYGFGHGTEINRRYARGAGLLLDDAGFRTATRLARTLTEHGKITEEDLEYLRSDMETLASFRQMCDENPSQALAYTTLSQIPVCVFGDSSSDNQHLYPHRPIEYGIVDELMGRFVTCDVRHVDSVRRIVEEMGYDIKVHPDDVLAEIDSKKTFRERRDIFQRLSTTGAEP